MEIVAAAIRSKFGLTVTEVVRALEELKLRGMQDCFKLLHFHLGSQIPNIRHIKQALNEAARVYAELYNRGRACEYMDVGGGLGVDYDGSQTDFESASITHCKSTPPTSSITFKMCVTKPGLRIRPSSVKAAAPSRPITACWFSMYWECWAWGRPDRRVAGEPEQPLIDLQETNHSSAPEICSKVTTTHSRRSTGDQSVQPWLPATRSAQPGRKSVLVHLPPHSEASPQLDVFPEEFRAGRHAVARPISATSRCSSRCPTVGPSSSCFR